MNLSPAPPSDPPCTRWTALTGASIVAASYPSHRY